MSEKDYKPEQVSNCCGATITVVAHASIVLIPYGGPPDPVEVCDVCNNPCEPVDVICENCKHFWGETEMCLGDTARCFVKPDEPADECDLFGIEPALQRHMEEPDW